MPAAIKARVGPGRFQWNAGAWFGSAIGCSAWMLVASCFLALHDQPRLASVPAIGFVAVSLVAIALWTHRDRIYPFHALMALFAVLAVVFPVVWVAVSTWASADSLAAMNWPTTLRSKVLVSASVPFLMAWFWLLERSAVPRGRTLS